MTTINERILFIIKHFCDGNKAEFARVMGEIPQTINGWLKRNIGSSVLNKIIEKFPEVSKTWLITGEGSMLIEDTIVPESKEIQNNIDDIEILKRTIFELSESNKILTETNARHSRTIERLTELLYEKTAEHA